MTIPQRDPRQPQYPAWDQPMTANEMYNFGEEFSPWLMRVVGAYDNDEHYTWCRDDLVHVDWLTRKAHQHAMEAITRYGAKLKDIDGKLLARETFRRLLKECEPDFPLYAWNLYVQVMVADLTSYGLSGQLPHPYTNKSLPQRYIYVNGSLFHAQLQLSGAIARMKTVAEDNNDILLAEAIADANNALEKVREAQRLKAQADRH